MAGRTPRVQTTSEPIAEVTKITDPVGQKNVAGIQINPATREDIGREFYYKAIDETVASAENFFISSGAEVAFNNLTVNGVYRNDGFTTIKGILTINGRLTNNGILEVGRSW
ncbi:hypothetical protein KJ925_05665 [Patescibacteria group bacterium]|nr:hypothetical protein [Patescibacteria group bacterium]